jgi:hypothetical protein
MIVFLSFFTPELLKGWLFVEKMRFPSHSRLNEKSETQFAGCDLSFEDFEMRIFRLIFVLRRLRCDSNVF